MQPPLTYRNTAVICKVILWGSYATVFAVIFLVLISLMLGHGYAVGRLVACVVALAYVGATHSLIYRRNIRGGAYMLILFYMLLATGMIAAWGINTPIALLLFALAIVIADILLIGRYALITAALASCILLAVQTLYALNLPIPVHLATSASSYADVLAYTIVFGMIALVAWLYDREVERSYVLAQHAQAELRHQKETLEQEVKRRTTQLRQTQLEEMQQMYRFSEIGQLGVNLLHDLANHLTALTLEVEGLEQKQNTHDIVHIRQITEYLDEVVQTTRDRLHGDMEQNSFDIAVSVAEAVHLLRHKAVLAGVELRWEAPKGSCSFIGDSISLRQVIIILTSNAIDAYRTQKTSMPKKRVIVSMECASQNAMIRISDWGKGISRRQRLSLFKPFHSTKESGLGLGLFLAKQTIETQFAGTLSLNPKHKHTEFVITIPHACHGA